MNRHSFIRNGLYLGVGLPRVAQGAPRRASANLSTTHATNIYQGVSPAAARGLEEKNLAKSKAGIDSLIAHGPFQASWASRHTHHDPEWFRDAKFGIYTHWGPVTVGSSYSPGDAESIYRAIVQIQTLGWSFRL